MVESRPDWCVSRQRAWGVPIAVFVDKASGEVLRDPEVVERIAAAFEQEGADAWFTGDPARFLGPGRDPADFEQVMDIVEVWFDSGSTHATVLEQRADLLWPASLYLEGSDQHRGWFQSSLLESCGTRGAGALRGGADARLRGRCRGAQDVEVARQRHLAARPDQDRRRRHPAPLDRAHRLQRGRAHRPGDPRRPGRRLPAAAQHACATCSATSPASARPSGCRTSRCRSWSAGCCTAWRSSIGWCARPTSDFDVRPPVLVAAQFLRHGPVGVLLRRAQGRALLRSRRQHAAPRRAHRARPPVPLPDGLAGAGAGVHGRGGLADALPVRGRQRASAPVPGAAGRLARSRARAPGGSASAGCAGS